MSAAGWWDVLVVLALVVMLASDVLLWRVWRVLRAQQTPSPFSLQRCAACGGEAGDAPVVVDDTLTALVDTDPIRARFYVCQRCVAVARADHAPAEPEPVLMGQWHPRPVRPEHEH